jgi:polysaccharide biosynthesis/export protein VpsN
MKLFRRCLGFGLTVACGTLLAGCLFHGRQTDESAFAGLPSHPGMSNAPQSLAEAVRFKVGDQVTVTLTGPPEVILPHQERVKDDGTITMNLIGAVSATNRTPGQLQREIHDLYVPKYYPRLTVKVDFETLYYTVGGEVKQEGPKVYVGQTTVTAAIQAAGGFTDYANRKKVQLTRVGAKKPTVINWYDAQSDGSKDPPVFPGDKIYVPKRLF